MAVTIRTLTMEDAQALKQSAHARKAPRYRSARRALGLTGPCLDAAL
jgi:hypothetical protein